MTKFMRAIDWWSEHLGQVIAWVAFVLTFFMGYNVIMRYAVAEPIAGEFDVSMYLYSFHFLLGGAWVLLHRSNVRVDIITGRWSPRARAIHELVFYIVFFFWFIITLCIWGGIAAQHSCSINELSHQTPWEPPLCPLKIMMVVAFSSLLLQGIVKFIRHVGYLRKGEIPPGGLAEGEIPS
jgi:TRAP-type mannitol/chloroaromatic compound transport system permease small subunit